MLTSIATFLVIATLVLGGTGATVAAAQGSLPDEPLYEIKLLTEDLRLALADDPRVDFDLTQQFLDERMGEIGTMVEDGETPPDSVEEGLQAQIEEALKLAMNLPPDQAEQALTQLRTRLATHMQALERLSEVGNEHAFANVFRTRVMMLSKMHQVEEQLSAPGKGKNADDGQVPEETPAPTEPAPAALGKSTACDTCTPAADKPSGKPDKAADDAPAKNQGPEKTKVPGDSNGNFPQHPDNPGQGNNSDNGGKSNNGKGGGKH